jgi:BT4734-like, N-terminal domain
MDITYKKRIKDTTISVTSLDDILLDIKEDYDIQKKVKKIRPNRNKDERTSLKAQLLYVFYPTIQMSDSVALRKNRRVQSTGLVQFDIDNITIEKSRSLKSQLETQCQHLLYAFISPSEGLKFAINTDFDVDNIDTITELFKKVYFISKKYVSGIIDVDFDDNVKSITQGCYISSDKDVFYNKNARKFPVMVEAVSLQKTENEEQERKSYKKFQQISKETDKEDIFNALEYIDRKGNYNYRFGINVALMKMLGVNEAIPTLNNFWACHNMDKLKKDIQSQAKRYSQYPYNNSHFFKMAIEGGYKVTDKGINKKPDYSDQKSTFKRDEECNVKDAQEQLENIVTTFFKSKQDTAILIEAGTGKTQFVLESIAKKMNESREVLKIAYFIQEHKLGQELKEKISKMTTMNLLKAAQRTSEYPIYRPIKGFNKACKIIKNNLDSGKTYLYKKSVCEKCEHYEFDECEYHNQYKNKMPGIRFYSHQNLFAVSALDYVWNPDVIVIDEDLLSSILDIRTVNNSNLVKKILLSYSEQTEPIEKVLESHKQAIDDEIKNIKGKLHNQPKSKQNTITSLIDQSQEKIELIKYKNDLMILYHWATGITSSKSKVWTESKGNKNIELRVGDIKEIDDIWSKKPILYLDASGEECVINKVMGRDFDFHNIRVKYNDKIEIIQVVNNSFSKNWILNNRDDAREIIALLNDNETGIISYKNIEGYPFAETLSPQDNNLWFGSVRGSNKFETYKQLVVLGRQMINPSDLKNMARIIFGKDEELDNNRIFSEKTVNLKNHKNASYKTSSYASPYLELMSNHCDKAETYQAVHRLRLIHGSEKKRVILLSNEVLDLTVDKLIDFRDIFISPERRKIVEAIKRLKVLTFKKSSIIAEESSLSSKQVTNSKSRNKDWFKNNPYFRTEVLNVKYKGRKKKMKFMIWWSVDLDEAYEIISTNPKVMG